MIIKAAVRALVLVGASKGEAAETAVDALAASIAQAFGQDNSEFDAAKFLAATELPEPEVTGHDEAEDDTGIIA